MDDDTSQDQQKRVKESLVACELFVELNAEQLSRLERIGGMRSVARGEEIFKQGDEGTEMFLICDGAVRVSRSVPGIGEEAFAVLGQGAVFGEMSVFDDALRSADAIAHSDCELFAVDKDALNQLFAHNRLLACNVLGKLVRLLSRRLRESNDKLAMLSVCARFE